MVRQDTAWYWPGLHYSAGYAFLNRGAWQSGWSTLRGGGELIGPVAIGAVVLFGIGVTTAATVVAFAKPFCTSWLRCSAVAFGALIFPFSMFDPAIEGTPPTWAAVLKGVPVAPLAAPLVGLGLLATCQARFGVELALSLVEA